MECKFKVGQTYTTRIGKQAKVIDIDLTEDDRSQIVAQINDNIGTYYINMRLYEGNAPASLDLMPPVELSLRVGGIYKRRDGTIVQIIAQRPAQGPYAEYVAAFGSYSAQGKYGPTESHLDIIEEVK